MQMHIKYVCKMIKKVCNSIHKMHNTFFKFGWFLFQVNLSVDLYSTTTTPALFGSLETFSFFFMTSFTNTFAISAIMLRIITDVESLVTMCGPEGK